MVPAILSRYSPEQLPLPKKRETSPSQQSNMGIKKRIVAAIRIAPELAKMIMDATISPRRMDKRVIWFADTLSSINIREK